MDVETLNISKSEMRFEAEPYIDNRRKRYEFQIWH